jgi:hypothetical protein
MPIARFKNRCDISMGPVRRVNSFLKFGSQTIDVLRPNLFKIFINDLPDYMLNTVDPIYLNNNRIDCLLYADDVILLSNSPEGLQAKLDCLDKLCKEWCMSVNIPKTKIITFNTLLQLFHKVHFLPQKMSLNRRDRFLGIYNVSRILKFYY